MHIFSCEHLHDIKFVFTVTQIVHVVTNFASKFQLEVCAMPLSSIFRFILE